MRGKRRKERGEWKGGSEDQVKNQERKRKNGDRKKANGRQELPGGVRVSGGGRDQVSGVTMELPRLRKTSLLRSVFSTSTLLSPSSFVVLCLVPAKSWLSVHGHDTAFSSPPSADKEE